MIIVIGILTDIEGEKNELKFDQKNLCDQSINQRFKRYTQCYRLCNYHTNLILAFIESLTRSKYNLKTF